MATLEQMKRALINADKAGDQEAASVLANAIRRRMDAESAQPPAKYGEEGYDPVQEGVNSGSLAGNAVRSFVGGVPFADEAIARASAAAYPVAEGLGLVPEWDADYGERVKVAEGIERGREKATPAALRIPLNIAGEYALAKGLGRAGLTFMKGGLTGKQLIGRGAAEGTAYGAAAGAGEADGGDRLKGALYGGMIGGGTGAIANALVGQAARIRANRKTAAEAPTWQSVRGQANAAYDKARTINPEFEGFDDLAMSLYNKLPDEGYHNAMHPQLAIWLDRVEELSRNGTAPTLKQLEQLRRLTGTPAGNFTNPDQQRLAKMARDALDEFMESAADRIPGNQLVPEGTTVISTPQRAALEAVKQGRALYRRSKNGELMARLFEMAEDRAGSTYSGANVENAIRQNLRKILDNPKRAATFNAEELAAIREVVRGTDTQNALRKIGSWSPLRGGLMSALTAGGTGAGAIAMGPLALVPAGVTMAADSMARAGTRSSAEAARALITGGSRAPIDAAKNITMDPRVVAIINALAAQGGGVAGEYQKGLADAARR